MISSGNEHVDTVLMVLLALTLVYCVAMMAYELWRGGRDVD